jgi:hypothetical protein
MLPFSVNPDTLPIILRVEKNFFTGRPLRRNSKVMGDGKIAQKGLKLKIFPSVLCEIPGFAFNLTRKT